MLHLARKAFFPSPPPFPLLHVDTTWKFKAMYELRDRMAEESGMELLVYQNPEAEARGINPFDHGPLHTDMWKTEGLKQALDQYELRRGLRRRPAGRGEEPGEGTHLLVPDPLPWLGPEEAAARTVEPLQRQEGKGESIRIFPISNWTELDIWQYIHLNDVPDRAALFRRKAADRGTGRHAAHGR